MRYRLNSLGRDYLRSCLTARELEGSTFNDLCREANQSRLA